MDINKIPPPSSMKSYEPDLEVIVGSGDKTKTYMYHGAILANKSVYIDTMLSLPMREQETKSISFPDVEPHEWETFMYHLEPLGSKKVIGEVLDDEMFSALAFYDKYQFHGGLQLCDCKISDLIKCLIRRETLSDGSELFKEIVTLSKVLSTENYDLPLTKSKDALPKYLVQNISKFHSYISCEDLKVVLSYVFEAEEEDQKEALSKLVQIVHGPICSSGSLEDMRSMIQKDEDKFVRMLKMNTKDNECHKDILPLLVVSELNIVGTDALINGSYEKRERYPSIGLGVMSTFFSKNIVEDNVRKTIMIQATDGLGSNWLISKQDGDSYLTRRKGANVTCLYKWHKGKNVTSLVPPRNGWESADIGTSEAAEETRIRVVYKILSTYGTAFI